VVSIFGRRVYRCVLGLAGIAALLVLGCQTAPIDQREGPADRRIPTPGEEPDSYEDSLTGGRLFGLYCGQCHPARPLAERPFLNYENVMTHMRVRANLTGVEYDKLIAFLQRFNDVPSPSGPVEPSPKRFIFSQPIPELRVQPPAAQPGPAAAPAVDRGADGNADLPPAIP
jgi:hypothetical protein